MSPPCVARAEVRLVPDRPGGPGDGPATADLAVLDDDERARAAAFPDPGSARRWVRAHAACRRIVGDRLGEPAARVRWAHRPCAGCGGPHGRPVVHGEPGLHFSLSHTTGLAAVALHDRPVGVDVEPVPDPRRPPDDGLFARALHPAERHALAALPVAARPLAFTHCWVRKEAVLKAAGVGLTREPDELDVGPGPHYGHPQGAPGGWDVHPLVASGLGDFVGAVAVRTAARAAVTVEWFDG